MSETFANVSDSTIYLVDLTMHADLWKSKGLEMNLTYYSLFRAS